MLDTGGSKTIVWVIALVACAIILIELSLIRVFDVIWYTNMSYMVITLAMLAFGLAGVFLGIAGWRYITARSVTLLCLLFSVTVLGIQPVINHLDFDFSFFGVSPLTTMLSFGVIYLVLSLPFFIGSLILTSLFNEYAEKIQILYGLDLLGASLGCLIIISSVKWIGPGGLLVWAAAMGMLGFSIRMRAMMARGLALAVAIALIVLPVWQKDLFEFGAHIDKRNYITAKKMGRHEVSVWDPVSKIDVFDMQAYKWIAYDGGTQTSYFYPFDGNFDQLRRSMKQQVSAHFWGNIVLASHMLKRDSGQEVLIIGSAGGQETKAALAFGAGRVDAVELVGSVIDLGQGAYADYIGRVYNHPKVNVIKGEGRTFLRSTTAKYDIIQMLSNHTSSSMGSGTGALDTTYLQTKDAYIEYFTHLKRDGVLHINHHIYPRMLATAARAWVELGRGEFQRHVAVFESIGTQDNLPTFLVKMSPWNASEINALKHLLADKELVIDPIDPARNYLPDGFFTGELSDEIVQSALYRVSPTTDDRPYFNFLRKRVQPIEPDRHRYTNVSVSGLLNSQLQSGVPMDIIHLLVTSLCAFLFAVLFTVLLSVRRKITSVPANRFGIAGYFACLGAGFIILELVFIQIFMKLIGFPIYTFTTVVFGFLLGAGLGSYFSTALVTRPWLPFAAIMLYCAVFVLVDSYVFGVFLGSNEFTRILATLLMIVPLTFFLGMAFPLGILLFPTNKTDNIVPWAWAFNGVFTVIGSIASVLVPLHVGFHATVIFAGLLYGLALWILYRRQTAYGETCEWSPGCSAVR